MELGNFEQAAKFFAEAGRFFEAAKAASEAKKDRDMVGYLQQVPPEDTHYTDATAQLAQLFLRRGWTSLAIEKLQRVLGQADVRAENLHLWDVLAQAYEAQEDFQKTADVLHRIMAVQYNYEGADQRNARALEQLAAAKSRESELESQATAMGGDAHGNGHRYELQKLLGKGGWAPFISPSTACSNDRWPIRSSPPSWPRVPTPAISSWRKHVPQRLSTTPTSSPSLILVSKTMILTYCGDPSDGEKWLVETLRLDPHPPDFLLENLAECRYLLRDYEALIEMYKQWKNPPLHMYTQLAAAYAQLDRMDEARAAFETYERLRPPDADFAYYLAAHVRLCKRQEDADHWVEGYRKAGFDV